MSVLTEEEYAKVVAAFAEGVIPAGLGDTGAACTVARVNLALTGELTDDPHPCIDETVRRFIIVLQDWMPAHLRNSPEYREVAPKLFLTGGTGVDYLSIILDWMWGEVLPLVQPVADRYGFGGEWSVMLSARASAAADAAADAAYAAAAASAAAYAASDAAYTAAAAAAAAADAYAADADAAADAAAAGADAAAYAAAAGAAGRAAGAVAGAVGVWGTAIPLLNRIANAAVTS